MAKTARTRLEQLIRPYRVTRGRGFRLKDFDPGDTGGLKMNKQEAKQWLQSGIAWLSEAQDKLYAQDRWAVLLVFQALDAAGKDSTIKHVMSGVNPQGCHVTSFKQPSNEELDHDYLWRCVRHVPARGMIGIFNRSYYEEVLVVRVHPEYLAAQKLAPQLITPRIWEQRLGDIASYEEYLARNGVVIMKFFLHVSREEQRRRFLARLDDPEKNWKFSSADVKERLLWDRYQEAYQETIRRTAAKHAPWYVVPADNKWYTRLVVAGAVVTAIGDLNLAYPEIDAGRHGELARARDELMNEDET